MTRADPPTGGRGPDPTDDLWADFEERLRGERTLRGRLRSLPTRFRHLAVVAVLLLVAGLIAATQLRSDLGSYPDSRFVASLAGMIALAVLGTVVYLRPLYVRGSGRRRLALLTVAALGAPLALAIAPEAHHDLLAHPESFADRDGHFLGAAGRCLAFGFVTGLPLIAALILFDRRDRRSVPSILLVAAAGGLAGNLALQIHCPLVSPSHLAAGHATVPLAFVLVVLAAAWRRGRARFSARGSGADSRFSP